DPAPRAFKIAQSVPSSGAPESGRGIEPDAVVGVGILRRTAGGAAPVVAGRIRIGVIAGAELGRRPAALESPARARAGLHGGEAKADGDHEREDSESFHRQ